MKHSEVKGASLTQVVDSSVNNPFADTMRENWENLAAAFNPAIATGGAPHVGRDDGWSPGCGAAAGISAGIGCRKLFWRGRHDL